MGSRSWGGMWTTAAAAVALLWAALPGVGVAQAPGFRCNACKVKASEVARCRAIDRNEASTGLLFNPPGMRSLYLRSSCLQDVAVQYRDVSLCNEVRERKSWFFDGSAISAERCRERVREQVATDAPVAIREVYRLEEVSFALNGNRRDLDLRMTARGQYRHQYELHVTLEDPATGSAVDLYRADTTLAGSGLETRRMLLPRERIEAFVRQHALAPPYRFRVALELVEPSIAELPAYAALPEQGRRSILERSVDPTRLVWTPMPPVPAAALP